jgi:hypothetical protein
VIRIELARGKEFRLHRELLCALERARSRMAVAIATENKSTPRKRWRQYLETEDRMRRCASEIRRAAGRNPEKLSDWTRALHLLKQPLTSPGQDSHGEAQLLCQRLCEVLVLIESDKWENIDIPGQGNPTSVSGSGPESGSKTMILKGRLR